MTKIDRAALSVFEAPGADPAHDGSEPASPTAAVPTGAADDDLLAAARALQDDVVAIRRRIHRRPEVGLDLPQTQAVILEELEKLGLEGAVGSALSSVVAVIEGGRPGPTVLLRADMDALPLHEDTGLDFASEVGGAMHACGHDTHVAMLLGAARLLQERRADLPGRVILMFQPGEEGLGGAKLMIEEGLLDAAAADRRGERASGALAVHIEARYRSGEIHLRPGPEMAATDTIRITVRGRGGHASAPHTALDPIVVAAEIVIALQAMVTRTVDVFDPAVVTIAQITAGTTNNIIPESVFLVGTIRTVSESTRELVRAGVKRVAEGIAAAHGATAEVDLQPGYPVTINDPAFTAFVTRAARDLVGPEKVIEMRAPIMGGEDFSYVLQQVPGAMAFVGAQLSEADPMTAPQNHSNLVVFDEAAMAVGVALYAEVAIRHLNGESSSR
ncbi:MAG TPA: M20 family metallopeptidase [Candidatus Limnocylindrales bacterium]|nr:M20 family metallopeptidase [Candidatus Limnocylindrales bacterium]